MRAGGARIVLIPSGLANIDAGWRDYLDFMKIPQNITVKFRELCFAVLVGKRFTDYLLFPGCKVLNILKPSVGF